jgi:Ca-activated chloride channel family protein
MTARAAVALAALCMAGSASAVMQTPTFSTGLEIVRLDVLVTKDGQPLRDLKATDFEVLDNGVSQRVELISFGQLPVNVILALDTSHSVEGARLRDLRSASQALLDVLTVRDRVALLTFNHAVDVRTDLTSEISRIRSALDGVQPLGDTALHDASYVGISLAETDADRALLIVFSDGVDTASWLSSDAVLEMAKQCDVVVSSVTAGAESPFLRDLGKITGGAHVRIESTSRLADVFVKILNEFRHRYVLSYAPQGVSSKGWHRLDVRVKGHRANVKARPGYTARF